MRVVVTGAAGAIGSQVIERLAVQVPDGEPAGPAIVAIDTAEFGPLPPAVTTKRVDLAVNDLAGVFSGADAVVHLAAPKAGDSREPAGAGLEVAILNRVLDGLSGARVGHLVIVSSAMVYGAWPGNPVPLTEAAPTQPNPEFAWAVQRLLIETPALQWGARTGAAVTVLRPTSVVASGDPGRLARALHAARVPVKADRDPPVQYLHVSDLANAVATALQARYDGPLNVSPDGWIPPDALSHLEGPRPRWQVPPRLARFLQALRRPAGRFGVADVVPYISHPWVVSSDRLRALGWQATHSNEEAWVVSHEPHPLERLPAGRRQQLLLGVAITGVGASLVALGYLIWRLQRRR